MGEIEKGEKSRSHEKQGTSIALIKLTLILLLTNFFYHIFSFTKFFEITADFVERKVLCIFLSVVFMVIRYDKNNIEKNIVRKRILFLQTNQFHVRERKFTACRFL